MRVKLMSLTLENFKGCDYYKVDLSGNNAVISGKNRSGKSTFFDAFIWLLFGKDSNGRTDFAIKPIRNGKTVHDVETSVTAVIDVDGTESKLRRTYTENWVKKRGASERTLEGHTTNFWLDDAPCLTKSQYDDFVKSIMDENSFRLLTTPGLFFDMKPDDMKNILFSMVRDITNEEVGSKDKKFSKIVEELNKRDMDSYKRMLNSKKLSLSTEVNQLPARITTARSLAPELEDWEALSDEIKNLDVELKELDERIQTAQNKDAQNQRLLAERQRKISGKEMEIQNLMNKIFQEANKDYYDKLRDISEKRSAIALAESEIRILESKMMDTTSIQPAINVNLEKIAVLREEFTKVYNSQFTMDSSSTVCPTCGQQLPDDILMNKEEELRRRFNVDKAKNLEDIKSKGTSLKAINESLERDLKFRNDNNQNLLSDINALKEKISKIAIPSQPTQVEPNYSTEEMKKLENELNLLKSEDWQTTSSVSSEDIGKRESIRERQKSLSARLGLKCQYEKCANEVIELESRLRAANYELADVEREISIAEEFQKVKDSMLEGEINARFEMLSFSFLKEQINSGTKVTCIPLVNGIPFKSANNADQINAGLDFINAMCKHKDVFVPIFLDNAEAVNKVLDIDTQLIKLVVTDEKLTIQVL